MIGECADEGEDEIKRRVSDVADASNSEMEMVSSNTSKEEILER